MARQVNIEHHVVLDPSRPVTAPSFPNCRFVPTCIDEVRTGYFYLLDVNLACKYMTMHELQVLLGPGVITTESLSASSPTTVSSLVSSQVAGHCVAALLQPTLYLLTVLLRHASAAGPALNLPLGR